MQHLLEKAILIALTAHKGQVDKGGNPYILHPLRLMHSVNTIEEKIVAILHDVVEDSSITTLDLKKKGFPKPVIDAITLLTKKDNQLYDKYILAIKENPLATVIKLADLRDNLDNRRLKKITDNDKKRIARYKWAVKTLTN